MTHLLPLSATFQVDTITALPTAARWLLMNLRASGRRTVLLEGEMGTGKTTLVRAVAAELGVSDAVSSPTYGLVHEYRPAADAPYGVLYHFDLYRLSSVREVLDLGIFDYLDAAGALSLIEWPERLGELLPDVAAEALTLILQADPATATRTFTLFSSP